jgi:predicted proteasome-type protease
MFKQWWVGSPEKNTVWEYSSIGDVMIADCTSRVLTIQAQRENARLIANAPQMYEIIKLIAKGNADAMDIVKQVEGI